MTRPDGAVPLRVVPLTRRELDDLVLRWHRHHGRVPGYRFALGCVDAAGALRGACAVARPVARCLDAREVAEVTRLVTDGTPNACSLLYGAAARAAREMGFRRIQTYTLAEEPGTSLRASGWRDDGLTEGRGERWGSRPGRLGSGPTGPKRRWVRELCS